MVSEYGTCNSPCAGKGRQGWDWQTPRRKPPGDAVFNRSKLYHRPASLGRDALLPNPPGHCRSGVAAQPQMRIGAMVAMTAEDEYARMKKAARCHRTADQNRVAPQPIASRRRLADEPRTMLSLEQLKPGMNLVGLEPSLRSEEHTSELQSR